jgi:hypothetical protein
MPGFEQDGRAHLPSWPAHRDVGIGVVGAGFIVRDCHLVVDFPPYLEAIKRLGIDDATISVELEYSPDPEHIVEWVAEAHDKTAALLRAAGLRP